MKLTEMVESGREIELTMHERILILLVEYNSLRDEVITKNNQGYNVAAIGMAALGVLLFQSVSWQSVLIFSFAIIVVVGASWWRISFDVERITRRIREIEVDVNDRAGEDLLVWENLWGAGRNGMLGVAFWRLGGYGDRSQLAKEKPVRSKTGTPIS